MTDQRQKKSTSQIVAASLAKRHRAESRFRFYGLAGILTALAFLLVLIGSIGSRGINGFFQSFILLDISFEQKVIDPKQARDAESILKADYGKLIRESLMEQFPDVKERKDILALVGLISRGAAHDLLSMVQADPSLIGTKKSLWLPASDDAGRLLKGQINRSAPESDRALSDKQITWLDSLSEKGKTAKRFDTGFFAGGDSREPEIAGIWGAIVGSAWTLAVTLLLSFPIGVTAAIYLEEISLKSRWTDLVEVNINNLAAVPSIVYGLLGLAVFLNIMHLPRSAPVVGGMVLALMTLPTIIIATRAALKAIPPSIREAARGLGASPVQVVLHHVLPLAVPGIMTGTIIGMSRALGESAPLLMIGMVAFIVNVPSGPMDPATVLPVQIFLWADSPERAFVEKTAAATLVLLVFLIAMNGLAVLLRNKFERRW